jgi:F0F1-type ATP synthase membrane subunit b/b'
MFQHLALLLQIRKIARRYKSQFEDLTKTVEEERKAAKEKEEAAVAAGNAAASAQEIPPETQEQLRDEGRKEVENKIKEAEDRHSDVVKELTQQVQIHSIHLH